MPYLQFLEGNARKAVAGFEGTPGGVEKAMRLLELRFGQPHMIAKACVVRTLLGWAIMGPLNGNIRGQVDKVNVNFLKYGNETLDQQMNQFLGLENTDSISSSRKGMSVQDREALGKLNSSVRLVDGHYEVGMLWKHENPWLPNNRMTAVARLRSLRRRLSADEQLCCKYRNFMDDLLQES